MWELLLHNLYASGCLDIAKKEEEEEKGEEKNKCQIPRVNFYLANTGVEDIYAQMQTLALSSLADSVGAVGKAGSDTTQTWMGKNISTQPLTHKAVVMTPAIRLWWNTTRTPVL